MTEATTRHEQLEEAVAAAIWGVYVASPIAREGSVGLTWEGLTEMAVKNPDLAPAVIRAVAIDEARSAIAVVREHDASQAAYGCHLDLFAMPEGTQPDGCVIDEGRRADCIYARDISCKEKCKYWQAITPQSIAAARGE